MMKSWHPSLPSFNPFVIVFHFLLRRLAKRDANAYAYPDYQVCTIVFLVSKGQLISKGVLVSSISSKKRKKTSQFEVS